MNATESTDVLVIGSGFGGAIAAYHLAAGGANVVVLERGPWLRSDEFQHDFELGSSSTRIFDFVVGDGMSILAGNCVGGGSVVYFATMPRAPSFVFDRQGSLGRRMWPASITRDTLDPWYDRVVEALPVTPQRLGRGAVLRRALRGRLRPRRAYGQPGAVGRRRRPSAPTATG